MSGIDPLVSLEIKEVVYAAVKLAIIDAFKEIEEAKKKQPEPTTKKVGFGG